MIYNNLLEINSHEYENMSDEDIRRARREEERARKAAEIKKKEEENKEYVTGMSRKAVDYLDSKSDTADKVESNLDDKSTKTVESAQINNLINRLSESYNEMKNFNNIFNSISILKENNIILESTKESIIKKAIETIKNIIKKAIEVVGGAIKKAIDWIKEAFTQKKLKEAQDIINKLQEENQKYKDDIADLEKDYKDLEDRNDYLVDRLKITKVNLQDTNKENIKNLKTICNINNKLKANKSLYYNWYDHINENALHSNNLSDFSRRVNAFIKNCITNKTDKITKDYIESEMEYIVDDYEHYLDIINKKDLEQSKNNIEKISNDTSGMYKSFVKSDLESAIDKQIKETYESNSKLDYINFYKFVSKNLCTSVIITNAENELRACYDAIKSLSSIKLDDLKNIEGISDSIVSTFGSKITEIIKILNATAIGLSVNLTYLNKQITALSIVKGIWYETYKDELDRYKLLYGEK